MFDFARFLGVTDSIINKAPSADFYEGQSDEADLGYSYSRIDEFLKSFIDKNSSKEELLKLGFEQEMIEKITNRVKINSFKRELPKIAQI